MREERKAQSLMDCLEKVKDPRGRRGRRYRLSALLAILILAALNGQTSLRGMWIWAREHSQILLQSPALWDVIRIPALDTFWRLLRSLDVESLLKAVNEWLVAWSGVERISLDEKVLRGSKREGEAALMVLSALGQRVGMVLEQVEVKGGDKTEAALALLERVPLEGKMVTIDAGLMQRPVIEAVVEKGGPTWGC